MGGGECDNLSLSHSLPISLHFYFSLSQIYLPTLLVGAMVVGEIRVDGRCEAGKCNGCDRGRIKMADKGSC